MEVWAGVRIWCSSLSPVSPCEVWFVWLDLKWVQRETGQSLWGKVPQGSNVDEPVAGKNHNKYLKVLILYCGVSVSETVSSPYQCFNTWDTLFNSLWLTH